jgi:hypothetical protein
MLSRRGGRCLSSAFRICVLFTVVLAFPESLRKAVQIFTKRVMSMIVFLFFADCDVDGDTGLVAKVWSVRASIVTAVFFDLWWTFS